VIRGQITVEAAKELLASLREDSGASGWKTSSERESGWHSFSFMSIDSTFESTHRAIDLILAAPGTKAVVFCVPQREMVCVYFCFANDVPSELTRCILGFWWFIQ
jgi:hypothetical protein